MVIEGKVLFSHNVHNARSWVPRDRTNEEWGAGGYCAFVREIDADGGGRWRENLRSSPTILRESWQLLEPSVSTPTFYTRLSSSRRERLVSEEKITWTKKLARANQVRV